MNCKPGDLAIVVDGYSFPQYVGYILRVISLHPVWSDFWIVDKDIRTEHGKIIIWKDLGLRPIRDNPGEDEMLRIAGKPHEVAA